MNKYMIEVDAETIDKIVIGQIKETYGSLVEDLAAYDAGQTPNIFFWGEPEKDKAEIQRHLDALKLLIEWYGVPGEDY